jgi:hypothetical protein
VSVLRLFHRAGQGDIHFTSQQNSYEFETRTVSSLFYHSHL